MSVGADEMRKGTCRQEQSQIQLFLTLHLLAKDNMHLYITNKAS